MLRCRKDSTTPRSTPKWYAFWESIGAFRADPGSDPTALLDGPAAAERDGVAPHGARSQPHAARHRRAVETDVRATTSCGCPVPITPASRRRTSSRSTWRPKGKTRHDLGREAFVARVWDWVRQSHGDDHRADAQARRVGGLVARAVHARRQPVARGAARVRDALPRGPDLPRPLHRQLVSALPDGAVAISKSCTRTRRASCGTCGIPASRDGEAVMVATTRPETMLGDTGDRGQPRRRAVPRRRSGARCACRSSAASCRSWPTSSWTPPSAPAPSR